MPDFNVISGSERPVTAAPVAGAERSLAGERAVLQGKGAIAQGVQDIGNVAGRASLLVQNYRNDADRERIKQAIRTNEIEFDTWKETQPDSETWGPEADARTKALKTQIESMRLAPVVKAEAENLLESWAENRRVLVQNAATRYRVKQDDAVVMASVAIAADNGNKDEVDRLIDKRVAAGAVRKDVAEISRAEAYEKADIAMVTRTMQDDPRAAIEQLNAQTDGGRWKNYKDLSETARLSLLRSAKNALESLRAEHAQDIAEQIYRGNVSGIDQRLDYEVKTGGLTAETASNLRSFARGQRSSTDMAADGSRLWQAAIDLDPSAPDAIQQEMQIRAAAHALSPEVRDPILDTLNQRRSNTMPPVVQQAYSLLERDYRAEVDTFTKQEVDALTSAQEKAYKKKFGRSPEAGLPKDPIKAKGASDRLFRYQDALRKFILANPKATAEQILAERSRLVFADTMAATAALAIDPTSAAVP